jgi:hypothetical protein
MPEPKTFEEFESYVKQNAYLYPFLNDILVNGNEENKSKLRVLQEEFVKPPVLECILCTPYYIADSLNSIEQYRMSKVKDESLQGSMIKWALPEEEYRHALAMAKQELTEFTNSKAREYYGVVSPYAVPAEVVDPAIIFSKMQPFKNVTSQLEKTISTSKIFGDSVRAGKQIYAFIGPKIDKWQKDRNGNPIVGKLDLNPQVKFFSFICAPAKDVYTNRVYDLRFVSDSEILCEKRSGAKGFYHTNRDEIERIHNLFSPGIEESVYFMAFKDEKDAEFGINKFTTMHNSTMLFTTTFLMPLHAIDQKVVVQLMSKKEPKLEDILKSVRYETHDKVPHSLIGTLLKNGDLFALAFLDRAYFILNGFQSYTEDYKVGLEFFKKIPKSSEKGIKLFFKMPNPELYLQFTESVNYWYEIYMKGMLGKGWIKDKPQSFAQDILLKMFKKDSKSDKK